MSTGREVIKARPRFLAMLSGHPLDGSSPYPGQYPWGKTNIGCGLTFRNEARPCLESCYTANAIRKGGEVGGGEKKVAAPKETKRSSNWLNGDER